MVVFVCFLSFQTWMQIWRDVKTICKMKLETFQKKLSNANVRPWEIQKWSPAQFRVAFKWAKSIDDNVLKKLITSASLTTFSTKKNVSLSKSKKQEPASSKTKPSTKPKTMNSDESSYRYHFTAKKQSIKRV